MLFSIYFLIFLFRRKAPENDIKYLIVDVSCLNFSTTITYYLFFKVQILLTFFHFKKYCFKIKNLSSMNILFS
jgi:hypothetical protein